MQRELPPKVLGHKIPGTVVSLSRKVSDLLPGKSWLVHRWNLADVEAWKPFNADAQAISQTQWDNAIATWIRPDLEDRLFVEVLAEEVIHHLQAAEGYHEIPRRSPILDDWSLVSVAWDLWAYECMPRLGIDMTATGRSRLNGLNNALKRVSNKTKEDLRQGKNIGKIFENYCLWRYAAEHQVDEATRREFDATLSDLCSMLDPRSLSKLNRLYGSLTRKPERPEESGDILAAAAQEIVGHRLSTRPKRTRNGGRLQPRIAVWVEEEYGTVPPLTPPQTMLS